MLNFIRLYQSLFNSTTNAMASFKDIRNVLLQCYFQDKITVEAFSILSDVYISQNLDLPYNEYSYFNLDNIADDECKGEFSFEKKTLPLLAEASQIPSKFRCPQKSVAEGMEVPCMLLKRLAYPCRYADMVPQFGRPIPVLCMVTN